MGKIKKQKKPRASGGKSEIKKVIVSRVVTALATIIFILFVAVLARAFIEKSDYFKLRTVDVKASFLDPRARYAISNKVLTSNASKNIFSVDLKGIASGIQASYGDVKDVVAVISLPDRIIVSLKLRRPVALVKGVKFYPVDEDGVVLPNGSSTGAISDLPVISGIGIGGANSRFTSRNLRLALELLGEIRLNRTVSSLGISAITVYDPRNVSFYFKNGVEVRIGDENFRDRLDLLSRALKDSRLILDNVKYIDTRFKDIIIGPK